LFIEPMTDGARKIALIVFMGHAALLGVLVPLTVAGHMAHGDAFQQAPLSLWLQLADGLLVALGLPLVPAATAAAKAMAVHLSAAHYLVMYVSNGICIACFAGAVHRWRARRKAGPQGSSACPAVGDTQT
jgi:hypothetical protein